MGKVEREKVLIYCTHLSVRGYKNVPPIALL